MKTSLLTLAFAAVFAFSPEAQARDSHKKKHHKDSSHHRSSHSDRSHHRDSYRDYGGRHLSDYYGSYRRGDDSHYERHDSHHRRSGTTIHLDF